MKKETRGRPRRYTYTATHESGAEYSSDLLINLCKYLHKSSTYITKAVNDGIQLDGWVIKKEPKDPEELEFEEFAEIDEYDKDAIYVVVNKKRKIEEFRNNLENCAEYIGCNQRWARSLLNNRVKHRTYELKEG